MKKLVQGIIDFRNNISTEHKETFAQLALGQSPDALFIACSDSRVVPNLFASTNPGDLFVIRNVGNLVPPCHHHHGHAEGCESAAAAIEFAVLNLKVRSIIVCGHSECGAMQSLIHNCEGATSPNLHAWLQHGVPALGKMKGSPHTHLQPHNLLSQLNVLEQIKHLNTYPIITERIEAGTLKVYGWWFDIAAADVYSYNEESGQFVIFDDAEAARVLRTVQ